MRARLLLAAALLAQALSGAAAAQEIRIGGDDRSRAADIAREILARKAYVVLSRDTTLPATFRAEGDVVVLDAEVRLEGAIAGSVAVLGGHLYLRPGSSVGGPIAVIDGGVYPSARAAYDEIAEANPGTHVRVAARPDTAPASDSARADALPGEEIDDGVFVERASVTGEDSLDFDVGIDAPPRRYLSFAPRLPTYDRVNGVTLAAGATWRVFGTDEGPRVSAFASYRWEQERPGGGVTVDVPLFERWRAVAEVSRATRTNDAWARGDVSNTVAALVAGRDYRDYWEADQASFTLARVRGRGLTAGETWLGPRIGVLVSDDRSLETRATWSILNRDHLRRENPAIDDGRIVSLIGGADLAFVGRTSRFEGDAQVERGLEGPGDFDFTHLTFHGEYGATLLYGHMAEVRMHAFTALTGDGSPGQRRGILGGKATLPTLPAGAYRGDRLLFVDGAYLIPVRGIELPFLGAPQIDLSYATGTAWDTGDDMPRWTQNVGAGLRFSLARVRVVVDPAADGLDPTIAFTASMPAF